MRARALVPVVAVVLAMSGSCGTDEAAPAALPSSSPPVTEAAPASTDTTSTTITTVPTTTIAPTTTIVPAPAVPWFVADVPGAIVGPVLRTPCCASDPPEPLDTFFQAWTVETGAQDGLVLLTVLVDYPEPYPGPEGDYATRALDVPEGQAWLLASPDFDDPFVGVEIRWLRANRDLWVLRENGIGADRFVDLVLQMVPGSGLPVVLPDPTMKLVSFASEGFGDVYVQVYELGRAADVWLSVRNDGGGFDLLASAPTIEPVGVAGVDGYRGTLGNGQVEVVWDAGGGWWASLGLGPQSADRADEIVRSVVPAALDPADVVENETP